MKEIIEALRVLISLFFLGVSSWYDFKAREVPNRVWVYFAPAGFTLSSLQLYIGYPPGENAFPIFWLLSFAVTTGVSLVFFYLGFFGGADAKALICLSVALPGYPSSMSFRFVALATLFPLAVLSNAVLGSSLLILAIGSHNLFRLIQTRGRLFEGLESESIWNKIIAFATGFKVDSDKLKNGSHYIPLESFSRGKDGEIIRHLRISPRLEEETPQKNSQLNDFYKELDGKIWATPGLPFLIFVTAGLVAALLWGDFISWLVTQMIAARGI